MQETLFSNQPRQDRQIADKEGPPLREGLRYIVIEGVIGAGKTTLTKLVSDRYRVRLVHEQFEENPFLERFYADRDRWAFQTQLSFLASRFKQQHDLLRPDLFHDVVVSDYSFDKDRIFAHLNLQGDELKLYENLFRMMHSSVPKPDLVVYLQASTDRLMRNIVQRGRAYEADMDREYIHNLNEAYNYYYFRYVDSPLLIVNADKIDFVSNVDQRAELINQIVTAKYPGTTYYNPET